MSNFPITTTIALAISSGVERNCSDLKRVKENLRKTKSNPIDQYHRIDLSDILNSAPYASDGINDVLELIKRNAVCKPPKDLDDRLLEFACDCVRDTQRGLAEKSDIDFYLDLIEERNYFSKISHAILMRSLSFPKNYVTTSVFLAARHAENFSHTKDIEHLQKCLHHCRMAWGSSIRQREMLSDLLGNSNDFDGANDLL